MDEVDTIQDWMRRECYEFIRQDPEAMAMLTDDELKRLCREKKNSINRRN